MKTKRHSWTQYSRKLSAAIERPRCVGKFSAEDVAEGTRLVIGKSGNIEEGSAVAIYWIVDEKDGIIIDAAFQAYGSTALIGAAEGACRLSIRSSYVRAGKITAAILDKSLRDSTMSAFPEGAKKHVDSVITAVQQAYEQCKDITVAEEHAAPILDPTKNVVEGEGYPGWKDLDKKSKIAVIENALDDTVRPYVELDGGGVDVIDLIDNTRVIIKYSGACAGCMHAGGATLSYIQQALRAKVSADIIVVPQLIDQ